MNQGENANYNHSELSLPNSRIAQIKETSTTPHTSKDVDKLGLLLVMEGRLVDLRMDGRKKFEKGLSTCLGVMDRLNILIIVMV